MDDQLRTGEVARICRVSPRTVSGWIDSGLLPGWRIPGTGGDRRTSRGTLLEFMARHRFPLTPDAHGLTRRVLLVGADGALADAVTGLLGCRDGLLVTAATPFAAGLAAARVRPGHVVVDAAVGRVDALCLLHALKADRETAAAVCTAVYAWAAEADWASAFDLAVRRDTELHRLAEAFAAPPPAGAPPRVRKGAPA